MPLIWAKLPTLDQTKHPHVIILPPPCFIVFWIFISLRASQSFRHILNIVFVRIIQICSHPTIIFSKFVFLIIFFSNLEAYFLANSNLFFLFILMKGCFDVHTLFSPDSLSLRRTVRLLTFRFIDSTIFRDDSFGFCFIIQIILVSLREVVARFWSFPE